MNIFPKLNNYLVTIDKGSISDSRKQTLLPLIEYMREKIQAKQSIRLNFICTHNSRRSHLAQIWAQTMAYHFGYGTLRTYSGGTEATALFPMVAETLGKTGFEIQKLSTDKNPVYSIKFAENEHPIIGFSKKYDDPFNPKSGFSAVMTCSQADGDCPFIAGAEKRIPITFDDPKVFDNTPQQAEKYLERSHQIATELFYVFSKING